MKVKNEKNGIHVVSSTTCMCYVCLLMYSVSLCVYCTHLHTYMCTDIPCIVVSLLGRLVTLVSLANCLMFKMEDLQNLRKYQFH